MLSHASGLYGAEAAMLELVEALRPHGIVCHVLLPRAGPLQSELENRSIPYEIVPYRWWVDRHSGLVRRTAKTVWNVACVPWVAAAVRRIDPDVVYTNTITTFSGALAARILSVPHVWHIHEYGKEGLGLRFDMGDRISYSLVRALSNSILVNSRSVAGKYSGSLPMDKIKVISQSVTLGVQNVAHGPVTDASVLRCAVLGYLQKEKGQHEAIEAAGLLAQRGVRVELWLIGSGTKEYEERLRALAREWGVESSVRFTGFVKNPHSYIQTMDIILVCSRFEGFGRVTVEAMLCGKPVIGSRSGCTAELVRDQENGLLYTPGSAADLADKIMHFHKRPEDGRLWGEQGRSMAASRFTQERYGAEVAAELRTVTGKAIHRDS